MRRVLLRCALGLGIFFLAGQTRADSGGESMLYWMIDESNEIEFQYAVVYATTEDLSGREWTLGEGYGVDAIALPKGVDGGFAYEPKEGSRFATLDILTELGTDNWSAYSFYIELLQWDEVNEKEIRLGVSQTASYADLVSNNHILGSGLTIPDNLVVWTPKTSTVPEPSSGILLLLGGALLALRRRPDRTVRFH